MLGKVKCQTLYWLSAQTFVDANNNIPAEIILAARFHFYYTFAICYISNWLKLHTRAKMQFHQRILLDRCAQQGARAQTSKISKALGKIQERKMKCVYTLGMWRLIARPAAIRVHSPVISCALQILIFGKTPRR